MQKCPPALNIPDITALLQLHKTKKNMMNSNINQPSIVNTLYTSDHAKSLPLKFDESKNLTRDQTSNSIVRRTKRPEKYVFKIRVQSQQLPCVQLPKKRPSVENIPPETDSKRNRLDKIKSRLGALQNKSSTYETTYIKRESDNECFVKFKPVNPNYKPISYSALNRIASEKNVRRLELDDEVSKGANIIKAVTYSKLRANPKQVKGATSVDLSISDECIDVTKPVPNKNSKTIENMFKSHNVKKANASLKSVKFSEINQIITYKQDSIINKKYSKNCGVNLFFCI